MSAVRPLWPDFAAAAPSATPIAGSERADLVVIGAGILGLTTALHAARQGLTVRVIEARGLGEGASGLNGGQVIPGLKQDPEELRAKFGDRTASFAASTADAVFDLIAAEKLVVAHTRTGWIQAAHTATALEAARVRVSQWQARGADVAFLDEATIAAATGARGYLGGWIDRRAGMIDPFAFTLGLARAATASGARIATGVRVTSLERDAGLWRVSTTAGSVNGARVLVAANAYADGLVPGLARSIVWLHSLQIATERLPADLADSILPEGQPVSDSRRIVIYYRKSPDGRLVLGGRGPMREPSRESDWAHLHRALLRLYPALASLKVERRWFGRVAMTTDHLPHVHEPEPGLLAVAGCNGRGIGLMAALGRYVADWAVSGDRYALPLPVTPIRPIPFHRFRRIGVASAIAWYRMRDATER